MKDTPHRVWDHNLQAMRDLAEDEWELESHWAGALEVHGKKMPGHDWVVVVPKCKLDAAEAALTAAEAKWRNLKERESDGRIEQEHRAERAEAALAEALDVIDSVTTGIGTMPDARAFLRKHRRLP